MTFTNTSKAVLVLNGRLIDPQKSVFISDDNLKANAHKILQYCLTNKGNVKDITGKQMSVEAIKEYINTNTLVKNEQVEEKKDDYLDIVKETIEEEKVKEEPVAEVKEEPVAEVKKTNSRKTTTRRK